MWKRKTEEDYEKDKKLLFLGVSLENYISIFIVSVLCTSGLYFHNKEIPFLITCFIFIFVLGYIGTRFRFVSYNNDICNTCHSAVSRSKDKQCECGGRYEPLDDWKWVEDESEWSEQKERVDM